MLNWESRRRQKRKRRRLDQLDPLGAIMSPIMMTEETKKRLQQAFVGALQEVKENEEQDRKDGEEPEKKPC